MEASRSVAQRWTYAVDADARSVKVYRMLAEPTRPEVVRDVLT
ncbi:MAG TPA: hypothetical protein VHG35_10495 [Gemmatimonadales bacterium]|nr:hypothetical protein [Gemmatimonadales bacterium]